MNKRFVVSVMLAFGVWLGAPVHHVQAQGAGFSMTPVLSDAQSKQSGFFDLHVAPGSAASVTVTLKNLTATTKRIKLQAVNAYTTDLGQVAYDPNGPKDDSAKVTLSQLTSGSRVVTLSPKQTQKQVFQFQIPVAGFKGIVLGSIYAIDQATYGDHNNGVGTSVRNRFAMTSAVRLATNHQTVPVALALPHVKAGSSGGKPAILATIQNQAPTLFGQLKVTTKVRRAGRKRVLMTRTANGMAMAPNSHFTFATPTTYSMKAGTYTLEVTAVSGNRRWHFNKGVKVTAQQTKQIDQTTSVKDATTNWPIIAGFVAMGVVILGLVAMLWWQKRR